MTDRWHTPARTLAARRDRRTRMNIQLECRSRADSMATMTRAEREDIVESSDERREVCRASVIE